MLVHRLRATVIGVALAGTLVLVGCGGSDGDSGATSGTDSEQSTDGGSTSDTAADDSEAKLAAFCETALDNQGGADIKSEDDPMAIAAKLSDNADTLAKMVDDAPSDVKADIELVADGARKMADALSADPSLEKFNSVIVEFAASDANTASQKVQTWVTANCGAEK